MGALDGTWDVRRAGGALPPLAGVRKRITGESGYTEVGPVRLPFTVDGTTLRYERPLSLLVDELTPDEQGFSGRATVAGREYGRFLLRPVREVSEMNEDFEQQLVKHIDEALGMEQSVLTMLDSAARTLDDDEVKEVLRLHRVDTERHIDRLRERLDAHGATPSLVREAGGIVGALMKSVLELTRSERAARGARDVYATEHLEIASYRLLERVATWAGDEATAEVARQNRSDEERLAAWIDDHWDRFAELALAERLTHA